VFNDTVQSLKLEHRIPPGTLTNGKDYNLDVTGYDISDNSVVSGKASFTCLTTPVWAFSNLTPGQVVRNASFVLQINYSQAQGERLNEYGVVLYSAARAPVWDGGLVYTDDMSVRLENLSDNSEYYARAAGRTVNGMETDTGLIPFSVEYEAPDAYAVVVLENLKNQGAVKISSNIVSIIGRTENGAEPVFLGDEVIDLRGGGSVIFDEGFSINGDYLLALLGYGFVRNEPIIVMGVGYPSLYWREATLGGVDYSYAELRAGDYVIFSDKIETPAPETMLYIRLRRVNGFYEVFLTEK
jgi:hypothetical protein